MYETEKTQSPTSAVTLESSLTTGAPSTLLPTSVIMNPSYPSSSDSSLIPSTTAPFTRITMIPSLFSPTLIIRNDSSIPDAVTDTTSSMSAQMEPPPLIITNSPTVAQDNGEMNIAQPAPQTLTTNSSASPSTTTTYPGVVAITPTTKSPTANPSSTLMLSTPPAIEVYTFWPTGIDSQLSTGDDVDDIISSFDDAFSPPSSINISIVPDSSSSADILELKSDSNSTASDVVRKRKRSHGIVPYKNIDFTVINRNNNKRHNGRKPRLGRREQDNSWVDHIIDYQRVSDDDDDCKGKTFVDVLICGIPKATKTLVSNKNRRMLHIQKYLTMVACTYFVRK